MKLRLKVRGRTYKRIRIENTPEPDENVNEVKLEAWVQLPWKCNG